MATRKTTINVTLTQDDVTEAVTQWARSKGLIPASASARVDIHGEHRMPDAGGGIVTTQDQPSQHRMRLLVEGDFHGDATVGQVLPDESGLHAPQE